MVAHEQISLTGINVDVLWGLEDQRAGKVSEKWSVSPSVRQSVSPSVSPSVRQFVSPSVRQSVSPSVRQSVSPSVRQSVSPSVRQSVNQLKVIQTMSQSLSWSVLTTLFSYDVARFSFEFIWKFLKWYMKLFYSHSSLRSFHYWWPYMLSRYGLLPDGVA